MHSKHMKSELSELKAETESIDAISSVLSGPLQSKVTPKLTELDLVYPFSVINNF